MNLLGAAVGGPLNAQEESHLAELSESPELLNQEIERMRWRLSPAKVKRARHFDDDEYGSEHDFSSPKATNSRSFIDVVTDSPIDQTNPYLRRDFMPKQTNTFSPNRLSSPVISPGKLKAQVTQSRAQIMEAILATQQEIEENSPSRASMLSSVNREMIQTLKQRRLLQRSKSREASANSAARAAVGGQAAQSNEPTTVNSENGESDNEEPPTIEAELAQIALTRTSGEDATPSLRVP